MMRSPVRYIASFSKSSLSGASFTASCVFGENGLVQAANKREGDKATPLGVWPVRRALFRADRMSAPKTALRINAITPEDGWCDDPDDAAYNRPVALPYPGRHEVLSRKDGLYDLVVVLGHNDDPPVSGFGSAIFLHCQSADGKPTLGCLAVPKPQLIELVSRLFPGDAIEVTR